MLLPNSAQMSDIPLAFLTGLRDMKGGFRFGAAAGEKERAMRNRHDGLGRRIGAATALALAWWPSTLRRDTHKKERSRSA